MTIGFTGGGGGTDWSSKTPKQSGQQSTGTVVNGSGFLIGVSASASGSSNEVRVAVEADGSQVLQIWGLGSASGTAIARFESSLSISAASNIGSSSIHYVLD